MTPISLLPDRGILLKKRLKSVAAIKDTKLLYSVYSVANRMHDLLMFTAGVNRPPNIEVSIRHQACDIISPYIRNSR